MHVDDVLRAGHLVQRVDVLGDDGDGAAVPCFEPGQRMVGGVGRDLGRTEQAARLVVEIEHLFLVAVPPLDRGHVLQVDAVPQAVGVAKGVDAAFLGDAGPGQNHDAGRGVVLMHVVKSTAVLG